MTRESPSFPPPMKALVYHGPGLKSWDEVPDRKIIDPTDAIVRIDTTTICGTDLHILKGDVPAVIDGRILGHEGVGTITEIGSAVSTLAVGERVLISCISACGACSYCHQGLYAHCLADEGASGIGWILGHLIDDRSLTRTPAGDHLAGDRRVARVRARLKSGEPAGIRTQDRRIKSPLLCH